MNPRYRSFSGALIAVLAVPVFLGLTACLPTFPVPVGNPEKSRIDPYITGIWKLEDENSFYIFEPYDKRTWVLGGLEVHEDEEYCGEEFAAAYEEYLESDEPEVELGDYEELILAMQRFGPDCYNGEFETASMKAWRTKLGGEWFMTWEPLGTFNADDGFGADEWLVFRIDTSVPNELQLQFINLEHPAWEPLEDLDEEDITQRAIEKVIRKNADDESFFYVDDALVMYRVLPEHLELFEDFIDNGW